MGKAEELLDSLDLNDANLYPISPEDEPHIVIGSNRVITVPNALKRIAVQYDHNVESVTFDCPRYTDGIDMSKNESLCSITSDQMAGLERILRMM